MPWFDDADKALRDSSEAVKSNPRDAKAYLYRGAAHQILSRPEESFANFTCVVELIPPDTSDSESLAILVEAHICLGVALARRNEPMEAVEEFTKAIELNPNRYLAYHNRGIAWSNCEELAKAIADYSRAIEINPNYASSYLYRGLAHRELGNQQSAFEDFTKVRDFNKRARVSGSQYRCGNRKAL